MFCQIVGMCYQLQSNTGVNGALLQSFLLSSRLTYGQENNHEKYFMYNGYLCIEPCLLANGCIRWTYPLVVPIVICKLKLRNIVNGTRLSLHWYGKFENYFPPLVFSWGMVVWTLLFCYIFHYDAQSTDHGFNFELLWELSLVSM